MSDTQIVKAPSVPLAILPGREPGERHPSYMARLAEMLPQPTEEVLDSMVDQVMAASSLNEMNRMWDANGSKDMVNADLIFRSIHMMPSDFADGLPFFLVCACTDVVTGEQVTMTTGSIMIVAELIRAQLIDALPAEAVITAAKRPTKDGNVPLHLRWVGQIVKPGAGPEES